MHLLMRYYNDTAGNAYCTSGRWMCLICHVNPSQAMKELLVCTFPQIFRGLILGVSHWKLLECRQLLQREQGALLVMCQMEEAKLLWAQGQQSMAMRVAWALLGSPGSPRPMEQLQRSRLQSLLGKWLSLNRCATELLLCSTHIRACSMSFTVLRA